MLYTAIHSMKTGWTKPSYDTLIQRVAVVSQVPHLIGGDFQGRVADTYLGPILTAAGWVNHARLENNLEHVTNRPYRGRAALLDDIWFAPALSRHVAVFVY